MSACSRDGCGQPTALRRSGLLVHEDRTLDAGHLPPTPEIGIGTAEIAAIAGPAIAATAEFERTLAAVNATLEEPTDELEQAYRAAGYGDMTPLEQRRMDGDR